MNLKNIGIMALIALVVALGVVWIVGGSKTTVVERVVERLGGVTGYDRVKAGDAIITWKYGTIASGSNEGSYRNTTGGVECVDLAVVKTNGTASSSMKFYGFATSSSAVPSQHDYTAIAFGGDSLISATLLATSTTATTTNSYLALASEQSGRGNGIVCLDQLDYFITYFQNASGIANAPNALCNGATCEEATSTNNGLGTVEWFIRTFATSTTQ